jgi:hypothetical protein
MFMHGLLRLGACWALLLAAGCPGPATAVGRAQDTAQEYNLNTRFGRTEIAVESVAPGSREAFAERHRAWGTTLRIADIEIAGVHELSDGNADVTVRATWYRADEEDLRTTTVKQHWHEQGTSWLLTGEERVDGDIGLLGEKVVFQAPEAERTPARFPTVRLSGTVE